MASKVHRIRYYCPKPRSINCVSYNKHSKLLAVAREDAAIEIWDINEAPYLIKSIPGVHNGSVEAIGWFKNRLLSTGLGGALVEWDLEKLALRKTVLLTGYAAWCLDVQEDKELVAIGTEQGYVNLFSLADEDIVYQKLFDKQEGRIICCKFDKTGGILVTGSVNTIRVWNVVTGQATTRICTKRRGKEVIVWSVAVLSDNTLVSGESDGRLTFWDSKSGDQIEAFMTHKSDILSIKVSDNEERLYCAGVDPVIVNFMRVPVNKNSRTGCVWAKNSQRYIHEHDVRCLELQDGKLISVGVDGYLTFSSFPPKWVMRIPPMLPAPRCSVSACKRLLLLRYINHLEIWKLGTFATNQGQPIQKKETHYLNGHTEIDEDHTKELESDSTIAVVQKAENNNSNAKLEVADSPVKLVTVHSKGHKQIKFCAMSPNGEVVVYVTESHIRMLKLDTDESNESTSVSRIMTSGLPATCDRLAFSGDSTKLFIHHLRTIYVVQIDSSAGANVVSTFSTEGCLKSSTLSHLKCYVSRSSFFVVAADTVGAVAVWVQNRAKFESYATLPKHDYVACALTLDLARNVLIVVYVDQKVIEYDLSTKGIVRVLSDRFPYDWFARRSAVTSVQVHPVREDSFVFLDDTSMWILDKDVTKKLVEPTPAKTKKTDDDNIGGKENGVKETDIVENGVNGDTENDNTEVGQGNKKRMKRNSRKNKHRVQVNENCDMTLRVIPFKYAASFHWLTNEEAVMVEILPEHIVGQLPDVVKFKRIK